jgi:hypothetical protein
MYRYLLILLALVVILGAGYYQGKLVNRWGESQSFIQAMDRITTLPETIGNWKSQNMELNAKQLQIAEVSNYVSRVYTNINSGEKISILLIGGRPGPIAVHSPDVCYQGAGYKMGNKLIQAVRGVREGRPPEFWVAKFTKEPVPAPLHIMWAWSAGGLFIAPDTPRLMFYREPFLYKLYIIREAKSLDAPLVDEVMQQFLKDIYPVLEKSLSARGDQRVS